MFFAKWPLRVEVHSLWPPPCWASCQHGCPGRLPAPTCRNSAPGLLNANTLSITLGRAPVLGVPAACGHGGPDLPSRSSASRSGGPWPPCSALGLGHSRAPGLPLTRLQPCVCAGPCTAAPGCKRPHTPGSESSTGQCQGRGEGTACPTGHCSTEHQLTPDLPEPQALLPGPGKLSPPPGRACAIAREIATLGLMAVRNCDYQTSSEVFTARSLHGGALRPSPAQSPPVRSKWISPRGHCPRLWAHIPPLALSPLTPTGPTWRLRAGPCPCTAPSPLPLQARPDPGSLWTTSSTCHFCPHSPLSNLPLKIPQPPHSSRDLPIPPVTPEVFTRWGRAST